ncbi:MAG: cysteate synthase [Terriglobales bacterium]
MKEHPLPRADAELPATQELSPLPEQRDYRLTCPVCGSVFEDDGFLLSCPLPHSPALLTTCYSARTFEPDSRAPGFYRYRCWLPGTNRFPNAPVSPTYQSRELSAILGLPNLWIAFSGYWPERGAAFETATFKELEVYGVLSRIPARSSRVLVVASAGNTAAAFARICSENGVPCLVVVPETGMKKMLFAGSLRSCVKIICLTGHAGYSDAISFAELISREDGFVSEGGVKNVGRRDGMATAMLNAVESIGRLPDFYFQAVGSGAGAIAAHLAAKRLVADSRFGTKLPGLMLGQNVPFTPIYDSWKRGQRQFVEIDPGAARNLTKKILATVLSNQRPPYSIAGGMFDVLCESKGEMFAVRNREVLQAMTLFETCEGIDIEPAAAVALASLIQAVDSGRIKAEAVVLLHITGGGARKRAVEKALSLARPDLQIPLQHLETDAALEKACGLFAECSLAETTSTEPARVWLPQVTHESSGGPGCQPSKPLSPLA